MFKECGCGKRDRDDLGDFGIRRRGEAGGDRGHELVSLVGLRFDEEGAARLDVDEHVALVGDSHLGERDAWGRNSAGFGAQQFDRNRCGQPPTLTVAVDR